MENGLEDLRASQLRVLLIDEVKSFVRALDLPDTKELEEKRNYLISIFHQLSEKEKAEALPIHWGKHASNQFPAPAGPAEVLE